MLLLLSVDGCGGGCIIDANGGGHGGGRMLVMGWLKMGQSEMRDLEEFLKRVCVHVFVYMIISAY